MINPGLRLAIERYIKAAEDSVWERSFVNADYRPALAELRQRLDPPKPYPLITKPCESCKVPVQDEDDPNFHDRWLCYYCSCALGNQNIKTVFNQMADLIKQLNRDVGFKG